MDDKAELQKIQSGIESKQVEKGKDKGLLPDRGKMKLQNGIIS